MSGSKRHRFEVNWAGKAYGKNQRVGKSKYGGIYLKEGYRGFKKRLTWHMIGNRMNLHTGWAPLNTDIDVEIVLRIHPLRDIDSLLPAIFDCLEEAEIISNDKQIRSVNLTKVKKGRTEPDHIHVTVCGSAVHV